MCIRDRVKRLEAENEGLKQDIANLQRQVQAEQREQTKMEKYMKIACFNVWMTKITYVAIQR